MLKNRQILLRSLNLFLIVFLCAGVALSQDDTDDSDIISAPAEITTVGVGRGIMSSTRQDEDKTGSIVRGRAFYEDTGKPVRRGWIGFIKIRELVQNNAPNAPRETYSVAKIGDGSGSADKYVLTNDQGEFVIRGVKAGVYLPTLKVKGVLNPTYADGKNPLFQPISIDGAGEAQVSVGIKRGGAVSGRILYPDGEPVIGARVQLFRKQERMVETYSPSYSDGDNLTATVTDDRGVYRFPGLPAGEYYVRVVEPTAHDESGKPVSGYEISQYGSGSELKTFYPSVENIKEAKTVAVVLGQENSDIDIQIPDRRLFKISGSAVAKSNKAPLKGMKVTFQKISDAQIISYSYDRSKQSATDEQGVWAFKDLPKGKYRVTVSPADDYSNYSGTDQPPKNAAETKYAPLTKEIELEDRDLPDLVFELAPQATISGTVTVEDGKPFPRYIAIAATDGEKKLNSSTFINDYQEEKTDRDKNAPRTFRIDKLSEGNFILNANSAEGYYIKSIKIGGTDLLNSPLELKDGENVTGVQIILGTDVGILKGKVNNFTTAERAFVVLIPADRANPENAMRSANGGMPNGRGEFEIKAAPGEYFVVVATEKNRPDLGKTTLAEWFKELTRNAPKVTIKSGATENITMDFPNE